MSQPTKLDDAIRNYARKYHKYMQVETDIPPEIEEAKQLVKDLMLEIIGEDEDIRDPADLRKNISTPIFRNSLRAEQRKRISEL